MVGTGVLLGEADLGQPGQQFVRMVGVDPELLADGGRVPALTFPVQEQQDLDLDGAGEMTFDECPQLGGNLYPIQEPAPIGRPRYAHRWSRHPVRLPTRAVILP